MAAVRRLGSVNYVTLVVASIWLAIQIQRYSLAVYVGASALMPDLGITAAGAGFLASVYYPVYGLVQIPSGILADQGRPKTNILLGSLATVIAALAFAVAPSFEAAVGARLVIGLSSGFLWMSQLKLLSYLPGNRYTQRLGLVMTLGNAGTIGALGGLPVLLSLLSWRWVAALVALPTLLTALALLIADTPGPRAVAAPAVIWRRSLASLSRVPSILARLENWQVFLPNMLWMGSHFAVLTWLPRYARDVLGMPPAAVGLLPALVPLGGIVGNILCNQILARRPSLNVRIFVGTCAVYAVVLALLASGVASSAGTAGIFVVAVVLGLLFGSFFISLAWVGTVVEPELMGTATGTMNGFAFLPAFVLPWAMGGLMDAFDRPTSPSWLYSAGAYNLAFAMLVVVLAVALVGSRLAALRARARRAAGAA